MLLDSPRLTDADRAAWAILERGDRMRAARGARRLHVLAGRAQEAIRRHLATAPAYVSMSWGKDSVTVAHLARGVDPTIPLVHGLLDGHENPESSRVAEEFLGRWPMPYEAVRCPPGDAWHRPIVDRYGLRRIMGIRATESGVRRLSAAVHGVATADVCRPILYWSTAAVFAYLALHDLPVHPSYAMSFGGRLDREYLRVDALGGEPGGGNARPDWEATYYAAEVR